MGELRLGAVDVRDAEHWRWLLTDQAGVFPADHEVALDPADLEHQGFMDLAGFLGERVVPDQRLASEAALVDRVGGWIGERVLGRAGRPCAGGREPGGGAAGAEGLVYRPLELAHVDGVPLPART